MKCVKTGFDFRDSETGRVHTGDLFTSDGEFFIRGIPAGPNGLPRELGAEWPPDAVVFVNGYDARAGRFDSHWTVVLEAVSPEFRAYMAEWNPGCSLLLASAAEATDASL